MNEPSEPAETVEPKSKSSRVATVVVGVIVIFVAAGGLWWLMQRRALAAESEARAQLKALGALISMDANRKYATAIIVRQDLAAAMPLIAKLNHLTHLDLADTDFDDEDVAHLKALPRLKSLVLSDTKISDTGVSGLVGLGLSTLYLAGTDIGAEAMDSVGRMTALDTLDLSRTNIQDHLQPLAQLGNLEWLLLNEVDLSGINDVGIDALANIPKLGRLTANGSGLSNAAAARLRDAKPALNLELGPAAGAAG